MTCKVNNKNINGYCAKLLVRPSYDKGDDGRKMGEEMVLT